MKYWKSYLKKTSRWIVLFAGLLLLMLIVLYVNGVQQSEVLYAAGLAVFIILSFFLFDFYQYTRKSKDLQQLCSQQHLALSQLPMAMDSVEEQYQQLLQLLEHVDRMQLNEANNRNKDMTEYYSMWVHQIKTPIAAMRLLLQTGGEKAEVEQELFQIEQYVEMVLQYLRLESSSTDYVFERQALDHIIRETIRKYAKQMIRKKLTMDYQGVDVQVVTDEKWMSFVLGQILSNALKYTRTGGIHIYMESSSRQALVIEDDGIGIAPEDLPRICERGYTGYNGRKDKSASGIGLYLCKRILDKLQYSLEISSQVGVGTKVTIVFKEK